MIIENTFVNIVHAISFVTFYLVRISIKYLNHVARISFNNYLKYTN